jgi:aryl-alcohol dehydrogenase-like predicted oxidoreductase
MNFGGRTPEAQAKAIVDRALERGVAFFDTANVYGDGESERLLGKALAGRREQAKIATKVGARRVGGATEGLSAARIVAALDESLERLKTDFVDLYYLHVPDPQTPLAQTLDGVAQVLASGKVKAWGVSNFASWQVLELFTLCDGRGLPRPAVSQVIYNLLVRQLDVEWFAFARAHPIHTTVYNPLAGGLLARAAAAPSGSRIDKNPLYRKRYGAPVLVEAAKKYAALAGDCGLDPVAFSFAWLAGQGGVDSILSGPVTVAHLDAALDGAAKVLTPVVRKRVDELAAELAGTDARYAR